MRASTKMGKDSVLLFIPSRIWEGTLWVILLGKQTNAYKNREVIEKINPNRSGPIKNKGIYDCWALTAWSQAFPLSEWAFLMV